MSVEPNFPTVDANAYQCAKCYVVAHNYSFSPLQYCANDCKSVSDSTKQSIENETNKNEYVLPHNMSCVQSRLVDAAIPTSQCQTQCLAKFNQCSNQC